MILDQRLIGFINIFERMTRAKIKDCFEEGDTLVFVVQPGEIRKAIGPGGENIRKASEKFKKKIKVIQFNDNIEKFVLNLLYPLKPEVELKEDKLVIKAKDNREKGLIFGREKSRLKGIQDTVNKYFKVDVVVE
ncbi:MAG: NusA-like transcription termination signal-binding factor [Nanoarchaeota archaeon]|nr:NusA-like transcription termination signal-binding factor [Nanoarchaeota archaeon]